jgi:hypothetical protein
MVHWNRAQEQCCTETMLHKNAKAPEPLIDYQPRNGQRMEPTAQAVGDRQAKRERKPRRGERKRIRYPAPNQPAQDFCDVIPNRRKAPVRNLLFARVARKASSYFSKTRPRGKNANQNSKHPPKIKLPPTFAKKYRFTMQPAPRSAHRFPPINHLDSYPRSPYSITFPSATTATYLPDAKSRNCTTRCPSRASLPHRLGFSAFCSIA